MKQSVRTVAVVGTGMMASSLAVLTAGHGLHTEVLARSRESEARCRAAVDAYFKQMTDRELLSLRQAERCKGMIEYTGNYGDLAPAEAAFECVTEELEVKRSVYAQLETHCEHLQAICSVSSSLVPDVLSGAAERYGDRILVTHPFNPPHLVPYFEVCAAKNTDPAASSYAMELLRTLDRMPVLLKKPTPGFIGNRLQFALWRECLALVEEGVCDPEDVDTALRYSFCPRYTSIGIFEHFDNGGLALNAAACRNIWPVLSRRTEIPPFMQKLMEEGKTGARSGQKQGFYDWNNVDAEAYGARVSEPYWQFCRWDFPKE